MVSVEIRFNEALAAIDKVGKREVFNEKASKLTTIESKLNAAEEVLKASRYIPKYNGAGDNSGYVKESDPRAESYRLITESLGLTDAQTRQVLGQAPAEIEALGEAAVREYMFCRGIRLTESEAIASVKKTFDK